MDAQVSRAQGCAGAADARDKLIQADTASQTIQYGYDIDGIRTEKSAGGTTTNYVVDHNRRYAQVLAERENGTLARSYTYGDDLMSQQTPGGQERFYIYDGLGSTRALADGFGSVTDTYDYEAFGELTSSTGSTENSYRFTGEQYDASLDQYYLRARYYEPETGRFTQMDSWQGRRQEPLTLHKYLYTDLDPVRNVDPSGRFSISSAMTAARIANIAVGSVLIPDYIAGDRKHVYEFTNHICETTKPNCTKENVFNALRHYPAPVQRARLGLPDPVNTGDELLLIPYSPIEVTVNKFSIVNETMPGHIFHDGVVIRKVVRCGSRICIRSSGQGKGQIAATNVLTGAAVWATLDMGVENFVKGGVGR